jgi:hypothetical protein
VPTALQDIYDLEPPIFRKSAAHDVPMVKSVCLPRDVPQLVGVFTERKGPERLSLGPPVLRLLVSIRFKPHEHLDELLRLTHGHILPAGVSGDGGERCASAREYTPSGGTFPGA